VCKHFRKHYVLKYRLIDNLSNSIREDYITSDPNGIRTRVTKSKVSGPRRTSCFSGLHSGQKSCISGHISCISLHNARLSSKKLSLSQAARS
jgi:hypothetical protein